MDDFKNAVDEDDIEAVKMFISKGVDPSFEDNWAIFQAYMKGFYDLATYLGLQRQVRQKLLDHSSKLNSQQILYLRNFEYKNE